MTQPLERALSGISGILVTPLHVEGLGGKPS